jgi:hypothetical protein
MFSSIWVAPPKSGRIPGPTWCPFLSINPQNLDQVG